MRAHAHPLVHSPTHLRTRIQFARILRSAVSIARLRRADAHAFAFGAMGRSPALAAGVTWTNRTTSAPWAARWLHTSVIDAAGAIYVIGGGGFGATAQYPVYNDVYVSTNGGADRTRAGTREVIRGYSQIRGGTKGT
jgi:hypothetical protein